MPCLALPLAKEHVELGLAKIGVERAQAADLCHQPGSGGSALFGRAGLQGSRVTALGFEGGLPALERAARDTEGITGCGYPVKPPDAVADVLHLQVLSHIDLFAFLTSSQSAKVCGSTSGGHSHS